MSSGPDVAKVSHSKRPEAAKKVYIFEAILVVHVQGGPKTAHSVLDVNGNVQFFGATLYINEFGVFVVIFAR